MELAGLNFAGLTDLLCLRTINRTSLKKMDPTSTNHTIVKIHMTQRSCPSKTMEKGAPKIIGSILRNREGKMKNDQF